MASNARLTLTRLARKHALALLALAVPLFIIFFPTLFMGRVLSPNDVYFNYDPWRSLQSIEVQNPIINDPPTSWYTLMSLLQDDPAAFHWNRWIGSGIPGYGALAAAVLSPFVLLPVLFLPLPLVYAGIIILKIVFPFVGAYLWLRQSRTGRTGAAFGAVVVAVAGPYAVWWLWQGTNATALYPWMMWMIRRSFDHRRVPLLWWLLLGISYLLSGFPATIIYGCWLGLGYAVALAIALRRLPVSLILRGVAAAVLSLLILSAPLVSFTRFLDRTGYLESRRGVAATLNAFGPAHLAAFFDPFRLGDPIAQTWSGPRAAANNFVETTVYLGVLMFPILLVGLFRRRGELRLFWLALIALLIGGMFFSGPLSNLLAQLPGVGYSSLGRLRVLLPVVAAPLAASGVTLLFRLLVRWNRWGARRTVFALTLLLSVDLGLFAAYFYPYVRPSVADVPVAPMTSWLRSRPGPFRVLPTFDMYWPNTAELARFEDIRSHFGSEAEYRRLLQRLDPRSWGGTGTVLQVNGLTLDPADPILSLLNVRYVLEQPSIDILRWRVSDRTTREAEPSGHLTVGTRPVTNELGAPADDVWAVELAAWSVPGHPDGLLILELRHAVDNSLITTVTRTPEQLKSSDKVYVPLPRSGAPLRLSVRTRGMLVRLASSTEQPASFNIGWVKTPLIHVETLPDGRVFELLSFTPRYSAVWNVESYSPGDLLEDRTFDFARAAAVNRPLTEAERQLATVPEPLRRVRFSLGEWTGASERLRIDSAVPAFVVASEKLVPELKVWLNGTTVTPQRVNGLFWGIPIDAGSHEILVTRRAGRGWWPVSAAGLLLAICGLLLDRRLVSRRG